VTRGKGRGLKQNGKVVCENADARFEGIQKARTVTPKKEG